MGVGSGNWNSGLSIKLFPWSNVNTVKSSDSEPVQTTPNSPTGGLNGIKRPHQSPPLAVKGLIIYVGVKDGSHQQLLGKEAHRDEHMESDD